MNVRLQYTMPFTAGVYYRNEMRMNHYLLRVWMTTNTTDPANHNTAFERIKYFVYQELDSVIFINSDNIEQCQSFVDAGLKIATMPGDPVDQIVGIMLFYKLNAIMEDRIIIIETELSSDLGDNMVYLHSEQENVKLPSIPDWWNSADLVHHDNNLIESEKVLLMHQSAAWRELDLGWPEIEDVADNNNTVVFADFKKTDDTK
jgi:hypothetical protein